MFAFSWWVAIRKSKPHLNANLDMNGGLGLTAEGDSVIVEVEDGFLKVIPGDVATRKSTTRNR